MNTKPCPSCGEQIPMTAQNCPHCHQWLTVVDADGNELQENFVEEEEEPSLAMKICKYIGWAIVTFGLVCYFLEWNLLGIPADYCGPLLAAIGGLLLLFGGKASVNDIFDRFG